MDSVLFVVPDLRIGGAQQQLLQIARGLDKSRFRPIVAPLYRSVHGSTSAIGSMDQEFLAIPGCEVVWLDRVGKLDFSPLARIASLIRTRDIHVVQPFLNGAILFGLLPALLSSKHVVTVGTERSGGWRVLHFGARLYQAVEDRLMSYADAVVANSEAGRTRLLKRGIAPDRAMVICNGIDEERLRADPTEVAQHRAELGVPDRGHVVGILATLTPKKDHDTFLRAAARTSVSLPGTRWAIVGDGPLRNQLQATADELGIAHRTVFFGYQSRVANFLAACDLVVCSSKDHEGHSNSLLEAMLLGVPVVATDIGGNRELVEPGSTGYLVPTVSPAALAGAIEHALTHPAETRKYAEQAKQMVHARFGLKRMVADYEALYEYLLESRQHRAAVHAPWGNRRRQPRSTAR